jgi:hypothetical protein
MCTQHLLVTFLPHLSLFFFHSPFFSVSSFSSYIGYSWITLIFDLTTSLLWNTNTTRTVPPRFTSKFQSENVRISENGILRCESIGDHPMTVTWMMDKKPLPEDSRYERRDESRDKKMLSVLKIESVKRQDSALFSCFVKNAYGEDESTIRLIVQEPPEPPRELKVSDISSRSVKLSWSIPFNGNNQILKYWITCFPKNTSQYHMSSYLQMLLTSLTLLSRPLFSTVLPWLSPQMTRSKMIGLPLLLIGNTDRMFVWV